MPFLLSAQSRNWCILILRVLLLLLPHLICRFHAAATFVLYLRLHQWFSLQTRDALIGLINQLHFHESWLVRSIRSVSVGTYLYRIDRALWRHLLILRTHPAHRLHLPLIISGIQTILIRRIIALAYASIFNWAISDNLILLQFILFFNGYRCLPYMMTINQRFHFSFLLFHLICFGISGLISYLGLLLPTVVLIRLSMFLLIFLT